MRAILILALLGVAACGADGDPIRPTATANVTMGSGGASLGGNLSVRRGPVTLGVGL